jgi:zinc transporter ZupT
MPIWQYLLLFATVFAGGSAAFFLQKGQKNFLQIVLSFSGAYILGITVLHLMPGVFLISKQEAGLWILAGFFVQLLLEQLSSGVEHGHIHKPHHLSSRFIWSVMAGLCIHALVEGVPLSYYHEFQDTIHAGHTHDRNHLLYGIILHHIPAAFALVFLFRVSGLGEKVVWMCLFIFAAMSPLGAALASTLNIFQGFQSAIIALVIGSLLHISTVILFEMDSSSHHYISWKKLAAIVTGLAVAILTLT